MFHLVLWCPGNIGSIGPCSHVPNEGTYLKHDGRLYIVVKVAYVVDLAASPAGTVDVLLADATNFIAFLYANSLTEKN